MEANSWKRVFPSSPLLTLSDDAYRIAARLNLGLPPHRVALPSKYPSCQHPTALRDDAWHHLSCQSHRRREVTTRHDAVLHVLYSYIRSAGGVAVKEPAGLSSEDGKRPDLQILFPSRHIITDVVISHSLAPSYIRKANEEQQRRRNAQLRRRWTSMRRSVEHSTQQPSSPSRSSPLAVCVQGLGSC